MVRQNLKQFVTSKTNWAAAIGLGAATYAFTNNWITYGEFMQALTTSSIAFGLRDAVTK